MAQLLFPQRSFDSFFSNHLKNKKPKTVRHYKYALADFRDFCSIQFNLPLEQCITEFKKATPEQLVDTLQKWANQCILRPDNALGRLFQIDTYLFYRGIRPDPRDLKQIQFPNYTPEKRRPVTDAQLEMLVANTKPDMKRLILFLTSTGMAIGEACHLRRKDIDLSGKLAKIIIKPSYTKKDARGRTVNMSDEAKRYCITKLHNMRENEILFDGGKDIDTAIDNYQTRFRRLASKLGYNEKYESGTHVVTTHALRAYFYTKAQTLHGSDYAHGILGHTRYLEQYLRLSDERLDEMYLELQPDLAVDKNEKLKAENLLQKKKLSEIDNLKLEMEKMKQRMEVSEKLSKA